MFLAYVTCGELDKARSVLCVVPDKPDEFSSLVPIESLAITDCAYHRVSLTESLMVWYDDEDQAIALQPNPPSKLFITPNLHDRPGIAVATMKIKKKSQQGYTVSYIQEGDPAANWKEWKPLDRKGSLNTGGGAKQ